MKASPEQLEAARVELEALEAEELEALYEAASGKVAAAQAAYNVKKAAIEENGVVAVRPNPINGSPIVVAPLRPARAALDDAFAERNAVEEKLRRIESLRRYLETGSTHAEFSHYSAPKLTPAQAAAAGGRKIQYNPETRRSEIVRSERAPVPVGTKAWREELAQRRAAGDQREAERRAAKERIRRSKANNE